MLSRWKRHFHAGVVVSATLSIQALAAFPFASKIWKDSTRDRAKDNLQWHLRHAAHQIFPLAQANSWRFRAGIWRVLAEHGFTGVVVFWSWSWWHCSSIDTLRAFILFITTPPRRILPRKTCMLPGRGLPGKFRFWSDHDACSILASCSPSNPARYQQYLPQEPVVMPYAAASPPSMALPVRSSTGHTGMAL